MKKQSKQKPQATKHTHRLMEGQAQTHREARKAGRQADRQSNRQTDWQLDRQTSSSIERCRESSQTVISVAMTTIWGDCCRRMEMCIEPSPERALTALALSNMSTSLGHPLTQFRDSVAWPKSILFWFPQQPLSLSVSNRRQTHLAVVFVALILPQLPPPRG